MAELNISGVFDGEVEKREFKRRISKACEEKNDETLIESISSYKKMGALRNEVKKGNEYFFRESLTNVRTLFRFRNDLFEAKLNFKNKKEYKEEEKEKRYRCDSCESEQDENTHVLHCFAYKELRDGKSLKNDKDL